MTVKELKRLLRQRDPKGVVSVFGSIDDDGSGVILVKDNIKSETNHESVIRIDIE